jgi:hypothetical protein
MRKLKINICGPYLYFILCICWVVLPQSTWTLNYCKMGLWPLSLSKLWGLFTSPWLYLLVLAHCPKRGINKALTWWIILRDFLEKAAIAEMKLRPHCMFCIRTEGEQARLPRPVVSLRPILPCPQGMFGSVRRLLWLPQLDGVCYWPLG